MDIYVPYIGHMNFLPSKVNIDYLLHSNHILLERTYTKIKFFLSELDIEMISADTNNI